MQRWKGSQEVISHGLCRGDALSVLGSGLKDDKIFLDMINQFQDGCHFPPAVAIVGSDHIVSTVLLECLL